MCTKIQMNQNLYSLPGQQYKDLKSNSTSYINSHAVSKIQNAEAVADKYMSESKQIADDYMNKAIALAQKRMSDAKASVDDHIINTHRNIGQYLRQCHQDADTHVATAATYRDQPSHSVHQL